MCSNTRVKKGFHKKGANCKLTVAPFFEKNYGPGWMNGWVGGGAGLRIVSKVSRGIS